MAKTILFTGVPSADLVFYTGTLLRLLKKKVLVVREVIEDYIDTSRCQTTDEEDIQPCFNYGIDWLTCKMDQIHCVLKFIDGYDYILYDIQGDNPKIEQIVKSVELQVIVTNGFRSSMNMAANYLMKQGDKKHCMLLIRDICNKRFNGRYFMRRYPHCVDISFLGEVWLDTYDTYYYQCIEQEEITRFRYLSNDMCHVLKQILSMLEQLTRRQMNDTLNKLMRGENL